MGASENGFGAETLLAPLQTVLRSVLAIDQLFFSFESFADVVSEDP